jgi:hypothetical protein
MRPHPLISMGVFGTPHASSHACLHANFVVWCPHPGFGPVPPDTGGAPRPGLVGTRGGLVSTGPGSAGAHAVAENC